jgi:hypothetical protein
MLAVAAAACSRTPKGTCATTHDFAMCDSECTAGDPQACLEAGNAMDGGVAAVERFRRACDKGIGEGCSRAASTVASNDGGKDESRGFRLRACELGDFGACFAAGLAALYARDVTRARRAYATACSHGHLFDGGTDACMADVTKALDALASAHDDCGAHKPNGCRREGELLIALRVDAPFEEECKLRGLASSDAGFSPCIDSMHEIAYCERKAMELLVTNPPPDQARCERSGLFVPHDSPPPADGEKPTLVSPAKIESLTQDIDRALVQTEIDRVFPELSKCMAGAEKFATIEPIRIAFGIDVLGEVPLAHFLGWPTGDTRAYACMLQVVRAMHFPPGPRNTTVDLAITPKNVARK